MLIWSCQTYIFEILKEFNIETTRKGSCHMEKNWIKIQVYQHLISETRFKCYDTLWVKSQECFDQSYHDMYVVPRRDKTKLFPSNMVIPRPSRSRRPRSLPLDVQLRITDVSRQLMQCSPHDPIRSDHDFPGAYRTTPLLVSTRIRRSTGSKLLGWLHR